MDLSPAMFPFCKNLVELAGLDLKHAEVSSPASLSRFGHPPPPTPLGSFQVSDCALLGEGEAAMRSPTRVLRPGLCPYHQQEASINGS